MLGDYLEPKSRHCIFRVQISVTVGGILSIVYKQGSNVTSYTLNGGVALTAGSLYAFDVLINEGDLINFQTSVGATIFLKISEIKADS